MKASDLLRSEVVASGGEKIGHVFEIVADKSGPVVTELQGPALSVCELLVGARASMLRLGYKSREMKGPHGLKFVQHRLRGYRLPWDQVESIEAGRIVLRCAKSDLAAI